MEVRESVFSEFRYHNEKLKLKVEIRTDCEHLKRDVTPLNIHEVILVRNVATKKVLLLHDHLR